MYLLYVYESLQKNKKNDKRCIFERKKTVTKIPDSVYIMCVKYECLCMSMYASSERQQKRGEIIVLESEGQKTDPEVYVYMGMYVFLGVCVDCR